MSDTPITPPAAPAPETPQARGYFNQGQTEDLELANSCLAAALSHPAEMTDRDRRRIHSNVPRFLLEASDIASSHVVIMKHIITNSRLPLLCATFMLAALSMTGIAAPETKESRDARMSWWIDARYGMFIHWDMSSVAGTEISWSRKATKPLDIGGNPAGYVEDPEYDNLYKKFNPVKFDAKAWVQLAKNAGMKYIVYTAKHHGGFCMWNTKLTDYSIMNTPFKRDVLKELADACHAANMPFGIYYSPRDWHHPDYGIGDNAKYVAYMNGQLRELLTNYGKVDILWFDSYGRGDLVNFWKIGETWDLIKSLQPQVIINNRLATLARYNKQPEPYRGDMDTPEQRLGSFRNTRPWESCMCVLKAKGGGWSYRPDGTAKSFDECLKTLLGCATGDGNLLLDVGPNAEGVIPSDQADPLLKIGGWLSKYGESIYGTRGGPYINGAWGGSTYKGATIYLHIAKWNENHLDLPPLNAKVLKATCLTSPAAFVTLNQTPTGVSVTLPDAAHDPLDTIIVLQLAGQASAELPNGSPLPAPTL